ncbi:hypothetical protein GCM10028807_23450 [Spirosoma daeguense]
MTITDNERLAAQHLTRRFLEYKDLLPYANINSTNAYSGWVTDFRLRDGAGQKIHLDLKANDDLFLLFVLAVVWSRTGPWENSAFFVAYLKLHQKHSSLFWKEKTNSHSEKELSVRSAKQIVDLVTGIVNRKQISFRTDIYDSVHVLATNWEQILQSLERSENEGNFDLFMTHMRNIEGLGVGRKKMLIKIPLILRSCVARIFTRIYLENIAACRTPEYMKLPKLSKLNYPSLLRSQGLRQVLPRYTGCLVIFMICPCLLTQTLSNYLRDNP